MADATNPKPEGTQGPAAAPPVAEAHDSVLGFEKSGRKAIARVDEVYNKKTRQWEYHRTRAQRPQKTRFSKYVIVIRRRINSEGFPSGSEVDVRGAHLQKALLELHKDIEDFAFENDPPTIDPRMLFHSMDGLQRLLAEAEREEPVDSDKVFELKAGIQFVDEEFSSTITSLKTLMPTYQINFENLWTLFPPSCVICGVDAFGILRGFKVSSAKENRDSAGNSWLALTTEFIDSNGKETGWVTDHDLQIPFFQGVKHIHQLGYFPIALSPDPDGFRVALIERGRLAIKRHGRQLVEYEGPFLRQVRDKWCLYNSHGRVMLDPETWERLEPKQNGVPGLSKPMSNKSLEEDEDKIMLLSSQVYGYSLGDKEWGRFSVSQTSDTNWNDQAFEALVLDESIKEFVHDLVAHHRARDKTAEAFDDVVRGKGKGLIGLLAGPPGVGKTLTAEAIAEISRRPLYTISSGELGHKPEKIQSRLGRVLELAEHWDAVVLLDEADCFLAARDDLDLARNASVSIFLRELEYYQGILILTTNRARTIDSAFQSRVHFSLDYPDLDAAGRRAIWRSFIDVASRNPRLKVDVPDEAMDVLAGWTLNGRQIKNAVSVSQTVALKRMQPLDLDVIQLAMRLSQHAWAADADISQDGGGGKDMKE